MYAIAYDMNTSTMGQYWPNYNQGYQDFDKLLNSFGFQRIQGSVFASGDLTQVYKAIEAIKKDRRFKDSLTDIRVFKIEDFSNFTQIVKNP